MGIWDSVKKIGEKSTQTLLKEAEAKVEKIQATIAAPEKPLNEARENLAQRRAQVASAKADAARQAAAGQTVIDYTGFQTALLHDENTVEAYETAAEEVRIENLPLLQEAMEDLDRAQKEHNRFVYLSRIRRFREAWVIAFRLHSEMMEAYMPRDHHPNMVVATLNDIRMIAPWDAVLERWANPPVKINPADFPARWVRIVRSYLKYNGTPDEGDEIFLTEAEAFEAVVAGGGVYKLDVPETRDLNDKAAEERARRRKNPTFAEDFPRLQR